ncbi:MAG: UvrD-helicase domain-containing protein, partial [Candidatus Sumerlaeia bacterium]|nr:UvrD-helicase domain-containing protein [Candidatus Sumerlaeia bacterium]
MHHWLKILEELAKKQSLNYEQRLALSTNHNLSVSASAGSGKTRVLTVKYLLYLLANHNLQPDNLVAITFTENAAAEMRSRVRNLINELQATPSFSQYHRRLAEIKFRLSLANISTIHSFCRRILAEYPLEAGLPPGFDMVSATSQALNTAELTALILREINDLDSSSISREDCIFLARHLSRSLLEKIFVAILSSPARLQSAIARFQTVTAKELLPLRTDDDIIPVEIEARSINLLAKISADILTRYEEQKLQSFTVDFDDLLLKTARLLSDKPSIRQRLAQKFRYFLVDEFQDTNSLQWEIIKKLCSTNNGSLATDKLFIVGDVKQSIYGFRDAEVSVFINAGKELTQSLSPSTATGEIMMNQNYRARTCLVDFTNFLFKEIMKAVNETVNGSKLEQYQPLICSRAVNDENKGQIEILFNLTDLNTDKVQTKYQVETDLIADKILEFYFEQNLKFRDMAILLRWTTHLQELETTLRRYNIPYHTVGGIGFYERQEIFDCYNLLQFLIDQNNDVALAGILRSPFFAFSDNLLYKVRRNGVRGETLWENLNTVEGATFNLSPAERETVTFAKAVLSKLIKKAGQSDVASLLEEALEQTGYFVNCSASYNAKYILANIEKLILLAQEATSLADFAEQFSQLIKQKPRESEAQPELTAEDAVKIMTIHQAKGLEFPVVFLPFLDWQFSHYIHKSVYTDPEFLVGYKLRVPSENIEPSATSFYRIIKEKESQRFIAEEKRLLYVGITRAMDYLILSASISASELAKTPVASQFKAKSPLDWIRNRLGLTLTTVNAGKITFNEAGKEWSIFINTQQNMSLQKKVYSQTVPDSEAELFVDREKLKRVLTPIVASPPAVSYTHLTLPT